MSSCDATFSQASCCPELSYLHRPKPETALLILALEAAIFLDLKVLCTVYAPAGIKMEGPGGAREKCVASCRRGMLTILEQLPLATPFHWPVSELLS